MAKVRIHRKGYTRKTYFKNGKIVPAKFIPETNYLAKDKGKKGKGKKLLPALKKGSLGVNFSMPEEQRHKIEISLAKKIGEKQVISKLIALAVLNKRTNSELAEKARADARFIAGSFHDKIKVPYPTGFEKKR
jgi:hypothetical protein